MTDQMVISAVSIFAAWMLFVRPDVDPADIFERGARFLLLGGLLVSVATLFLAIFGFIA